MNDVVIEINGHQFYRKIEGRVVNHCQTVEHFYDERANEHLPFQVPAIVVETKINRKLEVVPLKQDLYDVTVTGRHETEKFFSG